MGGKTTGESRKGGGGWKTSGVEVSQRMASLPFMWSRQPELAESHQPISSLRLIGLLLPGAKHHSGDTVMLTFGGKQMEFNLKPHKNRNGIFMYRSRYRIIM